MPAPTSITGCRHSFYLRPLIRPCFINPS
jgi:hypothetical protein